MGTGPIWSGGLGKLPVPLLLLLVLLLAAGAVLLAAALHRKRPFFIASFVAFIILVFLMGLFGPFLVPPTARPAVEANYLLGVVSTVATLAAIGFAIYGWYSTKEMPAMIEATVEEKLRSLEEKFAEKLYRQQDALQKVMASYGIKDPDRRIDLLNRALKADPTVYNGWIALGYAYWDKGDLVSAADCFQKDLEYHPDNHQAACDLAALYSTQGEWVSALLWVKRALEIAPGEWQYLERDNRLDPLRENRPDGYERLIAEAKRKASGASDATDGG